MQQYSERACSWLSRHDIDIYTNILSLSSRTNKQKNGGSITSQGTDELNDQTNQSDRPTGLHGGHDHAGSPPPAGYRRIYGSVCLRALSKAQTNYLSKNPTNQPSASSSLTAWLVGLSGQQRKRSKTRLPAPPIRPFIIEDICLSRTALRDPSTHPSILPVTNK